MKQLKGWGLDAIECYSPKYTLQQQTLYLRSAAAHHREQPSAVFAPAQRFRGTSARGPSSAVENEIRLSPPAPLQGSRRSFFRPQISRWRPPPRCGWADLTSAAGAAQAMPRQSGSLPLVFFMLCRTAPAALPSTTETAAMGISAPSAILEQSRARGMNSRINTTQAAG